VTSAISESCQYRPANICLASKISSPAASALSPWGQTGGKSLKGTQNPEHGILNDRMGKSNSSVENTNDQNGFDILT
jgi:hypothetical protein